MLGLCLEDGRFDSCWALGTIHSLTGEEEHCEGAAAADGQTADTSLGCGQLLHGDDDQHSPHHCNLQVSRSL